ncbi:MAG: Lrp/AsnC family transcriptional regulator [Calditrichaeota bacterium]|nr:MAG: Lrp/AsnC family transcriptional regulator [Calditrichota bacterium]
MHRNKVDRIDRQLLEILQERGCTKRRELARLIGMTIPSISDRLHKLENTGVIRGYRAILDPEKVQLEVTAFILLYSASSEHHQQIEESARNHAEILECHAITGEAAYLLKVRTHNTQTVQALVKELQTWPGVRNTQTSIALSTAKETTVLPLHYLPEATESV